MRFGTSNIDIHDILGTRIESINPLLQKALVERGLWDVDMYNAILEHEGVWTSISLFDTHSDEIQSI